MTNALKQKDVIYSLFFFAFSGLSFQLLHLLSHPSTIVSQKCFQIIEISPDFSLFFHRFSIIFDENLSKIVKNRQKSRKRFLAIFPRKLANQSTLPHSLVQSSLPIKKAKFPTNPRDYSNIRSRQSLSQPPCLIKFPTLALHLNSLNINYKKKPCK